MSEFKSLRKAFFRFDKMITPTLVRYFFIAMMVILGISAIFTFLSGFLGLFSNYPGYSLLVLVIGLPLIFLTAVLIRVFCEATLVLFKLNENMQKVADSGIRVQVDESSSKAA